MRQAASKFLFNYWNDLRKGRTTPVGEHIDPIALNPYIGSIFMLRREQDSVFSLALAGRHCEALAGQTLRGVAFGSLWDAQQARDIEAVCNNVVDGLLPVVIGAAANPLGYPPISLELMLLPLRPNGNHDAMILGSMTPQPGADWLGLRRCQPFQLVSHRFLPLQPIKNKHSTHAELMIRQEPRKIMQDTASTKRTRGHLAVYEGGLALNQHKISR